MSERLFVRDQVQIDASKIETDIDPIHGPTTTFKDVVIASEIVHQYEDGWAYKPADELEKAYWTWDGRWAIADAHPEQGLLMDISNIQGKTMNPRFVKNLNDHKTGRPNRRGILADLVVFDNKVSPETLTAMKSGSKRDVSIGFFFTKDETPGNWNGTDYSYVQRAFMGDHTAFGLENGRCGFPNCGIGADELVAAGDPFAGYETFEACIKDIMKENPDYTREQAAGTCAEIEKKSKAKHKKDAGVKYSMEKVTDLKSKVNEILSELDDLVEEEYQGNATYETLSERAQMYFNISPDEWTRLSEEEKDDYISRLPPEKKRAGGEEMSERDCTYEWDAVREKILELPNIEPMVLSKIFGDMTFGEDSDTQEESVTIPAETRVRLSELGVDLDDCECDEEESEEIVEDEVATDEVTEEEADEGEDLPSTEDVLADVERVWRDKERIVG